MKRFVFFVLALALLALPVSASEYTHLTWLAFTSGFAVGEQDSEILLIDSTGSFTIPDDVDLSFGGTGKPVSIEWTTADANANCLIVDLPTGGAVDVPVFGIASADSDFGYYAGIVEPTFFVENLAGSSFVALDFSATTLARLHAGGAATVLTIATDVAGADIVLDAADAAAGTSQTYVSITGSTPVHASGTPTDIFLDITPTLGLNTATATANLIDLTFTSPAWATGGATSTLRGIYFAPTIGAATAGTNTVALIDVAAISTDKDISLYGIRFGAMTGASGIENAIEIGSGWDAGLHSTSGIDIEAGITLANDEVIANAADGVVTITSDDVTGAQVTIVGADHNTTSDAVILLDADAGGDATDSWFIKSVANGNNFSLTNDTTELLTLTTAGVLQIDSDITIDGGDIQNTTAGAGIDIQPTMAASGSNSVVLSMTATQATHSAGTPTDIFLDFNPTFGINTVNTTVNLADLTFTTPAWVTGGATSTIRGLYFAPTIGNASAGTNTVALFDVAAITGDDSVAIYGMRLGAMTGGAGVENAIEIGAGWDLGINTASPITLTGASGDLDANDTITCGDLIIDEAVGTLAFTAATSATISTGTAGVGLVFDALDAAAGSNMTYASITGSVPIHASNTPTSIFLDISPTVAIPTVTNTVNLVDLTFTTPIYATGGATSTYRGIYFAPTIGAATNGTNALALIDVAAITGDDVVSTYGIRAGAMTGTAAVEDFISIGTGWDHAIDAASPVKATTFIVDDGSEDVVVDSDNQTATLPTINIPDFVDATADFLVTNIFTTTLPFAGGLRGEDTDGAGTNGGGLVGGAPDITTHTYTNATDDVFVLVYDAGTTTWDALATSALLTAGADWAANYQLLPDADAEEAGDAFAIGFATPFCEVVFDDLATAAGALATWGGDGGKWQYSTGAGTWSDLTVFDNTDLTAYDGLRSLQRTGAITFVPPADWVSATYDGQAAYWVQYVITAAQLTQTPLIDGTNHDEPFIAVPNADTFSAPFKLEITKVRVTNMHATVHDQNIVFIVGNFTDMVFSAAQTWTASQLNDKFTLGTAIAADPGDLIGICVTNDTGSTNNPIWAVEFEVTYED
jgi:hypothetical protein